jgi:hypothetical protein
MAWKPHRYYVIYLKQNSNITPDTMLCQCELVHESVVYAIERLKRYILVDIPLNMKLYKEYKWEYFYKTKSRKKIKDIPYRIYEKVQSGLPDFKIIETNERKG